MGRFHPEHDYLLYTPGSASVSFHPAKARIIQPDSGWNFTWRTHGIIRQLKKEQIDIFHGLSNELPFTIKGCGIKSVVSIHDVIFKRYPDAYPPVDRGIYNYKTRQSVRNADCIVASSAATAKDLSVFYGVPENNVQVIYPMLQDIFFENGHTQIPDVPLPADFILFVGLGNERKNLELVINLILALPVSERMPCIVIGGNGKYAQRMRKLIEDKNIKQYFIFIDTCTEGQLKYLYQRAALLCYPSRYEGFGMPVAEALLCGCPVIASDTSSLPEAGGDAALYCGPDNVEAAMQAFRTIVQDTNWKREFLQRAEVHVGRFDQSILADSWNRLYSNL